ncbi:MAG: hypothetical protein ACRCU6_05490 [Fusobacteriaceae bacterium]
MVKLFEVKNDSKIALPTEHCYINWFYKGVIEEYGDKNAAKIFYLCHCMHDLNPATNPYADFPENERMEHIVREVCPEIDVDQPLIQECIEMTGRHYQTPNSRICRSFKKKLDDFAVSLYFTPVKLTKEEGNANQLKLAQETYEQFLSGYQKALTNYLAEAGATINRGGTKSSYDSDPMKDEDDEDDE